MGVLLLPRRSPAATALRFGAATSDRVACGTGFNGLDPWTWLCWVYPTTLTANRTILSKRSTGVGPSFVVNTTGSPANLQLGIFRGTTNTNYVTNDTPLVTNEWHCLAVTFNSAAAAGQVVNIYVGKQRKNCVESTYGTATDGSGTNTDTAAFEIANEVASHTAAFQGLVGPVAVVARELGLSEIIDWQFNPRIVANTRLFIRCGGNGTGLQRDETRRGNDGTVTGATLAAGVLLPDRTRRQLRLALAAPVESSSERIERAGRVLAY